MEKCTINLIQSYETKVDSNSELERIVSKESFKDKLTFELSSRNLDLDHTESEQPITTPDLFRSQARDEKHIDYRVVSDEDHLSPQVGKAVAVSKIMSHIFNVNISSENKNSIEEKIAAKIENQTKDIREEMRDLRDDFRRQMNDLSASIKTLCTESRDPLIFRQLVFELKILAINKAFPEAKLPNPGDSSEKYSKSNGEFDHQKFDEDFRRFEKRMREEKMSESTEDLNRLFNFKLNDLNEKAHRPLSSYDNLDIVRAIESKYDISIEDPSTADLALVRFYRDWLNARGIAQQ